MSTVTVHVESEPHTENLSGVLLNRPLPSGGSFLISARTPRDIWNQMKTAGAWYLSADELEDMDMFDSEPGWRYTISALVVLLNNGYTLSLRGEAVTSEADLCAMFTAEAKAAYQARIERERQEQKQAAQASAERAAAEREAKGVAYAAWQQEHLAGLVETTVAPPDGGFINHETGWQHVASFDKTTPGTWYDTGDRWYSEMLDGVLIYQCHYGNATKYYAPQATVDAWVLAKDDGSVAYARHVLHYHNYGVFGADVADRLVTLRGLDHYIERASSEEWLIKAGGTLDRIVDVAAHYGIPITPVDLVTYQSPLIAKLHTLLGFEGPHRFARDTPKSLGQTADGRWFTTTDAFNGGGWAQLTEEQVAALGLTLTPPAVSPVVQEPRPLPSASS